MTPGHWIITRAERNGQASMQAGEETDRQTDKEIDWQLR